MAYKIIYEKNGYQTYILTKNRRKSRGAIYVTILLLLLAVFVGWSMNHQSDTYYAAETFLKNLYQGEDFADSITAFCRDVIESAGAVG